MYIVYFECWFSSLSTREILFPSPVSSCVGVCWWLNPSREIWFELLFPFPQH
jgi:hypothetical protein